MRSSTDVSARRRFGRRIGAAALALAATVALTGCDKAAGLGTIGKQPVDIGVPVPGVPGVTPNGKAHFAFTYYCSPKNVNGRVYTYWDTSTNAPFRNVKITGKVTRALVDTNGDGFNEVVRSCQDLADAPAAQFQGTYTSLDKKHKKAKSGTFIVFVFDQNNPQLPSNELTGDAFSIELFGGPHNLYTRAGYIEKGEIYAE